MLLGEKIKGGSLREGAADYRPLTGGWRITGSAGRAGRFTEGWVSKVSNSFLFLREGAGREWHRVAPRSEVWRISVFLFIPAKPMISN